MALRRTQRGRKIYARKMYYGEITDYTGKLTLGHNVQIGYFAQNQASLLDEELTVFQTVDDVTPSG